MSNDKLEFPHVEPARRQSLDMEPGNRALLYAILGIATRVLRALLLRFLK